MATERRAAASARLVIVDDHDLARAGLRSMLAGERGLEVIGEATNGREALALARRLQPNLMLMDVRMPEMDGLTATRAIKAECPGVSVIIVTMHENLDYLFEALKAGAAGYLLKDATQREVVGAVRQVLRGDSLLNGEMAARLLHRLSDDLTRPDEMPTVPLTPREMDVLRLLSQGLTNREIAGQLFVSVGTVKAHVE